MHPPPPLLHYYWTEYCLCEDCGLKMNPCYFEVNIVSVRICYRIVYNNNNIFFIFSSYYRIRLSSSSTLLTGILVRYISIADMLAPVITLAANSVVCVADMTSSGLFCNVRQWNAN